MAGAAAAQTAGPGGRTVYDAAFFRAFSPGSALDIVQRTPGFTLDIGSQDVRGFSQAAGNVVINGARPSAKNATLDTHPRAHPRQPGAARGDRLGRPVRRRICGPAARS